MLGKPEHDGFACLAFSWFSFLNSHAQPGVDHATPRWRKTMRVLALALLSTISFAAAALAQPGPSYYTDRATQERAQRQANGDYHDYWDPPGQRVYDRSARDR